MSKKIQLSIAEPCHENWDGMTPDEKGRFCGSCQKQVVDFSDMSDRQIAEFFKKPSTGSVCGRFMNDQLDRAIEIPKKRIPWVRYFFQFALPAFLVSMKLSAQKTQGKIKMTTVTKVTKRRPVHNDQKLMGMIALPLDRKPIAGDTVVSVIKEPIREIKGEINIETDTAINEPVCSEIIMGTVAAPMHINKNEIEGIVVDENNQPVPFASIVTGKASEGQTTDENGYFKIKKNWLSKSKGLIFSSVGFESRKIIAGEEEYAAGKLIVRLKTNMVCEEVVVTTVGLVTKGKVSMGYAVVDSKPVSVINKTNDEKDKKLILPKEENSLFVYPNPVQSGSPINISFKQVEEGYYRFEIINQAGQTVHQKEIWIDAEARVLSLYVPVVAAGSYFMVLVNKETGKKFSKKIIIQ